MSNITEKQTVVISINCFTFATDGGGVETKSQVSLPMNLRFAADALIVKNITYSASATTADVGDAVQIYCNRTNDGIIGTFPNSGGANKVPVFCQHNECFRLSNSFQIGNFDLQLQQTSCANIPPAGSVVASFQTQPLISNYANTQQKTFGIVSITLEFIKLRDKSIYTD